MKQVITKYTCDICGCENPEILGKYLQIIFLTDETEGKTTKPYLSNKCLDICQECMDKVLEGKAVYGAGCQGNNQYSFDKLIL